ncbi:MAG: pitrilysin family protein [Anaerolineales bacterium]
MAKRRRKPLLNPASLPGPDDIHRRELPNGIVVLARENRSSPSVVVMGSLRANGLAEDRARAGLAGLTASGLMRGTGRRSFQEIYESIEAIGASLGVSAGKVGTALHGKSLAEDLRLLLELLDEVLRHPTFPEDSIAQLRHEKLTGLAIRDDDTGARADLVFDEIAYPNHPFAIPGEGFRDSVSHLGPQDLVAFHRSQYGPRGMILCIVGAIDPDGAIDLVREILGSWEGRNPDPDPVIPAASAPSGLRRRAVAISGKVQADLVVGSPGPSRFDEHYLAAALGNHILGRFGLMGRIGEAVREKAGLAYYAYSALEGGAGPGAWKAVAGVHPDHLEKALDLIRREIGRIGERGVTARELEDNHAHFIGRLPLQLETNEGVAGSLLHLERYRLGLDYYFGYPERVKAIRREHIVEAIRKHLHPERLAIGIGGPPGVEDAG